MQAVMVRGYVWQLGPCSSALVEFVVGTLRL